MRYQFDQFVWDADKFELTNAMGQTVDLQPRSLELLDLLLRSRGALVDKKTTQREIWGGLHTSPDAMRAQVRKLRAALGDTDEPYRLIETVRGKGLRFVGDVVVEGGETPQEAGEFEHDKVQDSGTLRPDPPQSRISLTFVVVAGLMVLGVVGVALGVRLDFTNAVATTPSAKVDSYEAAVAVLPFRAVGGQPDQAYLGEGLADELSSSLARIDGFKVSSSSSAFRFSDPTGEMVSETANALGVTHIIEGSVAQVGSSLKVTVHLIDAKADDRIWTETYTRPYNTANIVRIQEQISSAVVMEMAGKLVTPSQASSVKTDSSQALDLYYRAQALLRDQTKSSVTQSIEYLKRAIEIDPTYVDPYSLLVRAYEDAYYIAGLNWDEANSGRRDALAKAMELAPNDNGVLIANAVLMTDDGESREAISLFQKALAADPNDAYALTAMAIAYSQIGRREEELAFLQKAREIDPLSPSVLQNLTFAEYAAGDTERALEVAQTNLRWNGGNPAVQEAMAWVLVRRGDYGQAHTLLKKVLESSPENELFALALAELYLRVGWNERATATVASLKSAKSQVDAILGDRAAVEQYLALSPAPDTVANVTGVLHFYLRDFDIALPYIKRAIEELEVTGSADMTINELVWFLAHAHVLCEMKDPDCEVLLDKLEQPLSDLTPQSADTYDAFVAGAGVQVLRGNEDKAIDWLEAALANGHTFVHLERHPTFERLAGLPRYQALLRRMETRASEYRNQLMS